MKDKQRTYDFAGWVTKNDILCSDGVIIKQNAFAGNDSQKVPLVWNHDYKGPENVLGHVILQSHEQGMYGYGYFNDTTDGTNAKELVKHGDISSMSIGASKIKRETNNVIHGNIYEVSLVMAGANPGALIETVMTHSESNDGEVAIILPGTLIHSADDIAPVKEIADAKEPEGGKNDDSEDGKTIQDVIDTMNDEQKKAVQALVGMVAEDLDEEDEEENKSDEGGEDHMKQNVFNTTTNNEEETLKHSLNDILQQGITGKVSSLQDLLAATYEGDESLKHGINSIEMLFPDAYQETNGNTPLIYKDPNTASETILNSVKKTPFSRIRTSVADLTEKEARAKGYIKGSLKKEEFFSLIKRVTTPTTIYKKQKLDRDDIIDISNFDIVAFMNSEMRMMLKEEIARALLIGDGREVEDPDKINETNIRPIIADNEFFTIQKTYTKADEIIEGVIKAMAEYRGSGTPTLYIDPLVLAEVKLLKGTDGRYLNGTVPSNEQLATTLGVSSIQPTSFMTGKGFVIVNLADYSLGANKGGEITSFEDFDIDFNQHKYLLETRLCGALTLPKSAIHFNPTTATTGADKDKGGLTYGKREADKTV